MFLLRRAESERYVTTSQSKMVRGNRAEYKGNEAEEREKWFEENNAWSNIPVIIILIPIEGVHGNHQKSHLFFNLRRTIF